MRRDLRHKKEYEANCEPAPHPCYDNQGNDPYALRGVQMATKKINPKNFTIEQQMKWWADLNYQCEHCGCGMSGQSKFHHRKPKSIMKLAEVEKLGPGGGKGNAAGLCHQCHRNLHDGQSGYEQFILLGHEEIPDED